MENNDYELIDNTGAKQYEFHIGNQIAKIEYLLNANNTIYLTHTIVPQNLNGQGIGTQLIAQTLDDIEKKGLKLVPLCPFVAKFIQKHPERKALVMDGIHIAED